MTSNHWNPKPFRTTFEALVAFIASHTVYSLVKQYPKPFRTTFEALVAFIASHTVYSLVKQYMYFKCW